MDEHLKITEKYLTPEEARKYFNTSDNTLRRWDKEGKIDTIRIGPKQKHRRYKITISTPVPKTPIIRKKICYARVSSRNQKEDLERQINVLENKYPDHIIIKDIGSGLNFKRKGFNTILEQAVRGDISEIVVTNKDRLCRFGFEIFEKILNLHNGKILVLYDKDNSPEQELVEDVLSVITVFSSRLYGRRSHRNKTNKKSKS